MSEYVQRPILITGATGSGQQRLASKSFVDLVLMIAEIEERLPRRRAGAAAAPELEELWSAIDEGTDEQWAAALDRYIAAQPSLGRLSDEQLLGGYRHAGATAPDR